MVSREPVLLFLLSLTGFAMLVFRNEFTSIRFESELLNYAFALVVILSLSISILWGAYKSFSGITRWVSVAVLGLACSFIMFFPVLFVALDLREIAKTGQDSSFEKIDEQVINGHRYCLYRTNGGATTNYGLILRKESGVFLGMKTVHPIKDAYPARDAKLEVLPSGNARLTIEPYSGRSSTEFFEFEP